ncbi:hypothetical protein [Corynebacterium accolens]|uniref:hypothetical protein n=1 Tax=Corynebacterium accolens TaxID=38284 RepID=UPI0026707EC9|nr:hypothetical protein [Corynebacterium accolens]WKS54895.1 hypothetical protein NLL31_06600 [Corynebacterium accolens]
MLLINAVVRAYDYLVIWSSGKPVPQGLSTVEAAAPLWLWSAALSVGIVLVLFGSFDPPRLLSLAWGHMVLFVVNVMIGAGSLHTAYVDDIPGGARLGVTVLMGTAAMSAIFAVATFYRREALLELAQEADT